MSYYPTAIVSEWLPKRDLRRRNNFRRTGVNDAEASLGVVCLGCRKTWNTKKKLFRARRPQPFATLDIFNDAARALVVFFFIILLII